MVVLLGKQSMDSRENFSTNKDNKTYVDEFYEKMLNMCGYTRQRILPGEEMATVKFTNSAGRKYLSDGYGDCAQWLKDDPDLTTDQKKAVDRLDKNTRKIHLLKKNGQITGFYIGDNSNEKFTLVEKKINLNILKRTCINFITILMGFLQPVKWII